MLGRAVLKQALKPLKACHRAHQQDRSIRLARMRLQTLP